MRPHLIPIEIMVIFLPSKIFVFLPLKIVGDPDRRGIMMTPQVFKTHSMSLPAVPIKMSTKINMPFLLANFQ